MLEKRESAQSDLMAFFDYYESAHRNYMNRSVHHIAHILGVYGGVMLMTSPLKGTMIIAASLPLSWAGHWVFERNSPAFFDQPEERGALGSAEMKARIALGGVVWSAACFLRILGLGPMAQRS